jgi:hypothetical protein
MFTSVMAQFEIGAPMNIGPESQTETLLHFPMLAWRRARAPLRRSAGADANASRARGLKSMRMSLD